jgi:hypothetical protein
MDDRPQVLENQPTGDQGQNSGPQTRPVAATPTLPTRRDGHQPDLITEKAPAIQALKKGRKPWAWWIVGAVVVALVVLVGFRFLGVPVETDEPEAGPVATSEIQVRDLTDSQEYTGQLQYDDAIPVAASGSGYLTGLVGDGVSFERGAVV